MNIIAFDLKTIPDIEGGRRLYNLHDLSDKDVANVMFHKRRQEGGGSEALRLHLQRVVAISLIRRAGESYSHITLGAPEYPEAQLLSSLFELFETSTPTLVSWNGNGFSLPVLNYRSLVHGIPAAQFWQALGTQHIDLGEALAGQGPDQDAAPLGEIASLIGFPGRAEVAASNQAWDAYLAGDVKSIHKDSELDALNNYLVYLRYQLIRGQLGHQQYEQSCLQVRESLQAVSKPHLDEFLAAWPQQA